MNDDVGLLRRGHVCKLLSVDRHTLSRLMRRDPTFPRFFNLSAGIEVVSKADVLAWIEQKRLASRVARVAP